MMQGVLKIGERVIQDTEFYPLLAQYQLLPRLAREMIVDEAIADVDCTSEEQEQALAHFYQQYQITNEEQLQAWLTQAGMTQEQLNQFVTREIKLEKFKQNKWTHQLESYFLECKGQLDRVVYSLIRTKEAGIAQELYFRIQEGESQFADLAREFSEGGEAQTGGLIGPVELNVPHPRIVQLLTTLPAGQLSPPTMIGEWWIILRLEKYLASQLDDTLRQRLRNDLFQKWLNNQLQQRVSY